MERMRCAALRSKIMSAQEALEFIENGMNVVTSGFTPSGYPKAVPLALAQKYQKEDGFRLNLFCGASVGDELDGALARRHLLGFRAPYQTNNDLRGAINQGEVGFADYHLSHFPQMMSYGHFGKMDVAIIEALCIREDGSIVPTTSVGLSPTALQLADKVIIEINHAQPMELEGIHDIFTLEKPPFRREIPLYQVEDRIGKTSMACDPRKIVAIVETHIEDNVRPLGEVDDVSQAISHHLIRFFEREVERGHLGEHLLPLQSGVGSVANAVLKGLSTSPFTQLKVYTEVIQDCVLDLIDSKKVSFASGTSFTPSVQGKKRLFNHLPHYARHCVLRPMEISNHPEIIRRLGVIAMNTAIEVDLYGHVNSTHIMGSRLMNGIGGSGDFARNAYLSIFSTPSLALGGKVSSIVPMVSHVDHTEHDVHIIITEQGIADLRGLPPVARARSIIENCAHPLYKDRLYAYLEEALRKGGLHEPHLLDQALSWHERFLRTGQMI